MIVGAGGHALVVADILASARASDAHGRESVLVGFVDDADDRQGTVIMGVPVYGRIDDLARAAHDAVIVAIGDNHVRARVFDTLRARGESFIAAIHPSAIVGSGVRIGDGAMLSPGVIIGPDSVIGDDVILNTGCSVDHHNVIDAHAHIAPGVHLGGEVHIGARTLVGIGATVIPGRTIGEDAIVGAGAVVTQDIPPGARAIGIPARAEPTGRADPGGRRPEPTARAETPDPGGAP